VQDGNWHNFVCSVGSSSISLYVDGVLQATGSHDNSLTTNNTAFEVGRGQHFDDNEFDGNIDEVRIYSRALLASEISYLYNKGKPIAHYKFDEGSGSIAYDSSGNGNTGTLSGSWATSTAWVAGKYGTALDFDGSDDHITIPDGTVPTAPRTVSMWFKSDNIASEQSLFFVGPTSGCNPSSQRLAISIESLTNKLVYHTGCGVEQSTSDLTSERWYHVVLVLTANTDSKIYLDGLLVSDSTDGQSIGALNNALIGAEWAGGAKTRYFNGLIDDVRIYNYARTPQEIQLDYNAGLGTYFR